LHEDRLCCKFSTIAQTMAVIVQDRILVSREFPDAVSTFLQVGTSCRLSSSFYSGGKSLPKTQAMTNSYSNEPFLTLSRSQQKFWYLASPECFGPCTRSECQKYRYSTPKRIEDGP